MMNTRLDQLLSACRFLTRLPLSEQYGQAPLQASYWAFPVIGGLLAILLSLLSLCLVALGLSPSLVAGLVLVSLIVMTGALHEDGLADTADGFGGGWTAARKLAIMRDSQLGTYGILAMMASVGLRFLCLQELAIQDWRWLAVGLLVALPVSRAGLVALRFLSNPPDSSGLAASQGKPDQRQCQIAILLAAFLVLFSSGFGVLLWVCVLSASLVFAVRLVAQRQIGGVSGDVLGATEQLLQLGALLLIVIAAGAR